MVAVVNEFWTHLLTETKIPNVISYTVFIVVLSLLFAIVLSRDMDDREEKLSKQKNLESKESESENEDDEDCFSEEQNQKLEEHNSQVEEKQSGLPDVYLLIRVSYHQAEELLSSGGDVRFVSFGNTDIVIHKGHDDSDTETEVEAEAEVEVEVEVEAQAPVEEPEEVPNELVIKRKKNN